ncbi:hypothetical protein LAHI110946_12640 [Lactococcus hircilactis]
MSNPLANTASHNIQWYFDTMGLISRTQITIGINEVANLTRTISYDGQETKLSRLISVINNFNAEFEFITKLNNDGTLDSVTLNIYKENDGQNVQGVGTKRDDVRLSFGKNIEDVTVDVSDDGFFNACYMTGADGYSWKNYDFSYKNADGVEEFYKRKGSEIAYAPLSAQMFPSQLKTDKGDIWTSIDETTEYKNANDMWGYIVKKFKQYAYHQITYTVTPSAALLGQLIGDGRPLQKGDTVIIQDNNYIDINGTVGLILSARVSEIIESESNPENNQIVFSNYKKLKSQASADIQSIVSQLVDEATPYRSLIETTNGMQFKNGTGSTVLTARIYKGSSDTETVADSYVWTKDGTAIATTQAITVNATDIVDKSVYTFKATVGGKTVGTWSVTITNVNDGKQGLKGDPGSTGIPGQAGADGKTSYLHIAYATNATGTAGFDVSNSVGKTYIGQYTDFTANDSTDPSKYSWSLIKGDKGDKGDTGANGKDGIDGLQGKDGQQGIPGKNGADGKTQYTHIAYANSADGTANFSTSDSNRTYIGMYVDFNANDSTTPSDYSWTLVKGADGTQGTPGKAGADGKTPYFHTAWSYSTDGTDRFTTVYPNLNLLDGTSSVSKNATIPSGQNSIVLYGSLNKFQSNTVTISAFLNLTNSSYDAKIQAWTNSGTIAGSIVKAGQTGYSIGYGTIPSSFTASNIAIRTENVSTSTTIPYFGLKMEPGSTATPWMPSQQEATTADYPSYIGQYTDFTQADSTNSSAYTWSLIRGNDGVDGTNGTNGTNGKDGISPIAINMTNEACVFAGSTTSAIAGNARTDITASQGTTAISVSVGTISGLPTGMTASISNNNSNKATVTFNVTTSLTTNTGNITIPVTAGGVTQNQIFTYALALAGATGATGANGTNGTNGSDGYTVILTNESNTFSGSTTSAIASSTTTTVVSYKGANAISSTVGTITGLPTGMSYSVSNNSTNSPVITFTVTTSMVSRTGNINVPLTIDGKSFTKVFSYALALQGATGNTGANGTNGKDGTSVTITSKQILYQNSTSGTTAPTGTWSTTIPSTPQGQFRWARTIVNYSDGTSTQTDLVGYVGVDGQVGQQGKPTGITQQATEPSNKYAGMMWQYTGTSNITIGSTTIAPQVQYIYDGAQWRIYAINVANLNVQTLSALTANLGTVTAGMIKSYIDYTYYNNSPTGIPAKAYLRIDANNVNQKIALQSPSGVDWGYIRQDVNGITIFADTKNAGTIGNASGRYVSTNYGGAGISFINSNNASINANGDLDVATPYTGTGSLYFDGTNLISSAPIIALNTIVKSYSFSVGGLGVRLDRLMSQVMVTFSGQVTSAITGTPTFNNQLPIGFCPINPASVDYMVVGNINANGYIYFNPDGSIRFMANVPQGAYIRGTRSYITADAYPS